MKKIACFAFLLTLSTQLFAETIVLPRQQSSSDTSFDYRVKLLKLALSKSKTPYEVTFSEELLTQGRAMRLLNKGKVDVVMAGPTQDREALYRAIHIPLMKGLLGHRVFIINKSKLATFEKLTRPEELQELNACQGLHWPDSDILDVNGFKVSRVLNFESMFSMVDEGNCDYFPRSIIEGYSEIEAYNKANPESNLVLFDNIILKYKFPLYYFTSRSNEKLAKTIEYGLLTAMKDGSFAKLMQEHTTTSHIYPLEQWNAKTFIELENPLLPFNTPINNESMWLDLKESSGQSQK
ncbi:transporter substrate-binding domain-containing protein [Catenovulum sp. SM1970]|uniref:transporter substrate-binding domain-containing protein n=1 Tax=Marinifaba aquimaris TaxID=2741323 RepID=UPI0015743190|nr:transporter substrate-binding domain-containing protein [Marinifaba aquimaris]NTS77312.1 transporter substrate-binding domain-containing protein [Marinifaba aquimaris]